MSLASVLHGSSRSSFINKICKFVRDVDEMNDTVLVPSLLTDLSANSPSSSSSPSSDRSECLDLQTVHQLLNRLKDELTIARFDDDNTDSTCFAINCNPTPTTSNVNCNKNNTNQITCSSSSSPSPSSSLRIAEGDLKGLSKKLHSSCKCADSDDGFSSLNSYSRNGDDESTSSSSSSSSPASDSDSECCSSSSNPNQSRESECNAESSPEYIVNLLKLHIQGIQSILTRFSKYADQVSETYVNSLDSN